jgi:hypothetical protein
VKRIVQQCAEGRDDNPESVPHYSHRHHTKHGREVWCRGWFPHHTTVSGGIRYTVGGRALL